MAFCRSEGRSIQVCWPRSRPGLLLSVVLLVSTVPRGRTQGGRSAIFEDAEDEDEDDETFLPENIEAIHEASEFEEKVVSMINFTEANIKPEYYPTVLFHVTWCKHCFKAIKELNAGARKLYKEFESDKKKQVLPKLFTVRCDTKGKEQKEFKDICVRYVGNTFPSLIMFRQQRELRYAATRSREALIYKWWMKRAIRPLLQAVENTKHLKKIDEPTFILKADDHTSKYMEIWQDMAAFNVEDTTFAVTSSTSEIGVKMHDDPAVRMWAPDGAGLSPISFMGTFEIPELKKWVAINQLPMLVESQQENFDKLRKCDVPTVVLVHGGRGSGRRAIARFAAYIKNLRPQGEFAFTALDSSEESDYDRIKKEFPLLVNQVATYPRIIVFRGKTYWEDPFMDSIDKATPEGLQALMEDEFARQSDDTICWFKEKWKIYTRFAQKSVQNTVLALVMPVLLVFFLARCLGPMIVSLCAAGDDDDDDEPDKGSDKKKE